MRYINFSEVKKLNKKNACTILALCASFIFSGIYFLLFSLLKEENQSEISVIQEENNEIQLSSDYLSWLQLGVFKEQKSYEDLLEVCLEMDLDPYLISFQDKTVVVVACSEIKDETEQLLEKIKEKNLEYILKEQTFTQKEAQEMIAKKEYEKVLEGYVYQ